MRSPDAKSNITTPSITINLSKKRSFSASTFWLDLFVPNLVASNGDTIRSLRNKRLGHVFVYFKYDLQAS